MDFTATSYHATRSLSENYSPTPGEYPNFKDSDSFFNHPPPSPQATLSVGISLFILSVTLWLTRVRQLRARCKRKGINFKGSDRIRGMLACLLDNDDPFYTIVSYSATSLLFLGGIQINYELTLTLMLLVYAISSFGDSLRVILAFIKYDSLSKVEVVSDMSKQVQDAAGKNDRNDMIVKLDPSNVYEDIAREPTIVIMLFFTQALFICIVCYDVWRKEFVSCIDGTKDCPVGHTMGSYVFYIIGIFQACVYMLGPKTSYGKSEQNAPFWMILMIASKKTGAHIMWHDTESEEMVPGDKTRVRRKGQVYHISKLTPNDFRMWSRFIMSYIVNGIGFHILVHALPLQVAQQTNFLSVVFRAVGMMYLVDLDDSKGMTLFIEEKKDGSLEASHEKMDEEMSLIPQGTNPEDSLKLAEDAQAIIDRARAELDALAKGGSSQREIGLNAGAGAFLGMENNYGSTNGGGKGR